MDPGLLRRYSEELGHLREVGAEFAREFPKIASRLTMDGLEVADPYVERLLEGFAFMAARVQLKLDAEYPRFVQHLLETVYPNALSPQPSALIARFDPDLADPQLGRGPRLPRGSAIVSESARGQNTRCEFRTAHAVQLWPLTIEAAQYFSHAGDLPLSQLAVARQVRGGLRLRLQLHGGLRFDRVPMESLRLHLCGPGDSAWRLHELLFGAALGTLVVEPRGAASSARSMWRGSESLRDVGFADEEALLPETLRGFSGHRLMQELAMLPQRFLFVELAELAPRLARVAGDSVEIVVLFGRADAGLEPLVDREHLALHCSPAVNLFSKRLDRIQTRSSAAEFHVVPDRTRPMDFEVHSLLAVTGFGSGAVAEQAFVPLYSAFHTEHREHAAYYTLRREQRLLSQRQREQGTRSGYIGSEVFLSLVDPQHAPYAEDLRQLAVQALVTNRDLPSLLPAECAGAWRLDTSGPVLATQCLLGPTRSASRVPEGELGWSLISQLTLNYLSIAGEDPQRAAAALRALLDLQGLPRDLVWRKQVEGVTGVSARCVTRRLPFAGPLTFGAGVQIEVDIDEIAFQGASAFLLGQVLERFFARQASLNSFTETLLRSSTRGVIFRGVPRVGTGRLI